MRFLNNKSPNKATAEPPKALAIRDRDTALKSRGKDALTYLCWAIILLTSLTIIGTQAANWSPYVIPIVCLIYAIPATIGSMYRVVINKLHKQQKLNEHGSISGYNRKWLGWLLGLFLFYLVSGFFFIVQAPGWNSTEWVLMWCAIIGYFIVYQAVQYKSKREFSSKYYKESAIKWSIGIMTAFLCVAFAFVTVPSSTGLEINISEMIQNRYMPFQNSPCALLAEADKIASYTDCLTEYGLHQIQGYSYAIAVFTKLILSIPVFFGVVSQLSCCMLSPKEAKSVIQLLPVTDNENEETPILLEYIIAIIVVWSILSLVFIQTEHKIEEVRETKTYTVVDEKLNEITNWIVLASEHTGSEVTNIVKEKEARDDFNKEFKQKAEPIIQEQVSNLEAKANAYYDACINNVDSYLEWHDSAPGGLARFAKFWGEGEAIKQFEERIINPADSKEINEGYSNHIETLKGLYNEYVAAEETHVAGSLQNVRTAEEIASRISNPPNLWPSWSEQQKFKLAKEVLLSDRSRDDLKQEIANLINVEREQTLTDIRGLSSKFFYGVGVL